MRDPDIAGPRGRAYNLEITAKTPDHTASLAVWLLNVPGVHPFWSWWLIGLIHLRDIPGVKPAVKQYAEAEYEFIIQSINPEECPNPDPDKCEDGYPTLIPVDVVEQFHVQSDMDAKRLVEACLRAVVAGQISPDQDFRPVWKQCIADTARHFREGKHPQS